VKYCYYYYYSYYYCYYYYYYYYHYHYYHNYYYYYYYYYYHYYYCYYYCYYYHPTASHPLLLLPPLPSQLLPLSVVHTIAYAVFTLTLPLLWHTPTYDLFFRLATPDRGPTLATNILNYGLLSITLTSQLACHCVLGVGLYCLIVKRDTADVVRWWWWCWW